MVSIDWPTALPTFGFCIAVTGAPAFFVLGRTVAAVWCALSAFWAATALAVARGRHARPFGPSHAPMVRVLLAVGLIGMLVSLAALGVYVWDPTQKKLVEKVIRCVSGVIAFWVSRSHSRGAGA
jgi:hypothetical protein